MGRVNSGFYYIFLTKPRKLSLQKTPITTGVRPSLPQSYHSGFCTNVWCSGKSCIPSPVTKKMGISWSRFRYLSSFGIPQGVHTDQFKISSRRKALKFASLTLNLNKVNNLEPNIGYFPYGTWALSSFNHSNSTRIQPMLEIEKVIANLAEHEDMIKKRGIAKKPDLSNLISLFDQAKQLKKEKEFAQLAKEENAEKVKSLLHTSLEPKDRKSVEVTQLREKGKILREDLRKAINKFNVINDDLVNLVLSIPNQLDSSTPLKDFKVLRDIGVKDGVEKFSLPADTRWEYIQGIGPAGEFAIGSTAMLEMDLATKCQKFLLAQGFSETGNVDFVKRLLLDGSGLDPSQFLQVREPNTKSRKNHAAYLVGGATFPAFLALFAQSVIQDMSKLPIKFFVIGRCYTKGPKKTGALQSTAVQVFIACKDAEQEEGEFQKLADSMECFYSEVLGIPIQNRLLPAPQLRLYEKKKIVFVTKDNEKSISDLTTVGDYVSKRLLCCYNDNRLPKFLHLITGQFFNITEFIRPLLPVPAHLANENLNSGSATSSSESDVAPDLPAIAGTSAIGNTPTVPTDEEKKSSPSSASTTTSQSSSKTE